MTRFSKTLGLLQVMVFLVLLVWQCHARPFNDAQSAGSNDGEPMDNPANDAAALIERAGRVGEVQIVNATPSLPEVYVKVADYSSTIASSIFHRLLGSPTANAPPTKPGGR